MRKRDPMAARIAVLEASLAEYTTAEMATRRLRMTHAELVESKEFRCAHVKEAETVLVGVRCP